jgi:hypothetical protein
VDKDFLMDGIVNGFHIRNLDKIPVSAEQDNYKSATCKENRGLVENQIKIELEEGRYIITESKPTIVSALGAIKKEGSGEIRLIHDASRPIGRGLNEYATILEKQSFQTVAEAEKMMTKDCFMAKVDLKSAYRYVRLHETDYQYTGLKWKFKGQDHFTYMYDTRLPFGSRLAPGIFHRITQSIRRAMARRGFNIVIVYLDDFLIIAETEIGCQACLECLLGLLRNLGWAISWSKVEGPRKVIKFLGVILDSEKMCLELPEPRLQELHGLIRETLVRKRITLKQLQSLAGKLNWASQVVRGGRTYLRRILDTMAPLKLSHHKARISNEMRADLQWWDKFLHIFNGKALALHAAVPTHMAVTDACNIAAGLSYRGDWAYVNWQLDLPQVADLHINYKETVAIILAAYRWAPMWRNSHVQVLSDNITAKSIINKGTCKNRIVMGFIRELCWLSAIYNFKISVRYIPGVDNRLADTISRLHEKGQLMMLESLLRTPGYMGAFDLKLPLHLTINGLLFISSQIQWWLGWKENWMRR